MNRDVDAFDILSTIAGIALLVVLIATGSGDVIAPLGLASLAAIVWVPLLVLAHELGHARGCPADAPARRHPNRRTAIATAALEGCAVDRAGVRRRLLETLAG